MTYPNTEHNDSELGGPPHYPSSEQFPPEYWRKQPAGDPDNRQTITVDYGDHSEQRVVEPGWNKPVYIGPREDDPNHGVTGV